MSLAPLILNKNEERRLRAGHLWVFSNEVDSGRTPLTSFEPGQPVEIVSYNGQVLGSGYVNPHSLICARLVARRKNQPVTRKLLQRHIEQALTLRERLYPRPFYRLVFGESDFLPGLIIDRFGEVLVVQITTAGMEAVRDDIIAVLEQQFRPAAIVLRNDSTIRELEGLQGYREVVSGSVPATVEIEENGQRFLIDPQHGQKTGWFFDHRDNRARMKAYVAQRRVLDVFSYGGAWGVQAASAGASAVCCVDSASAALDLAEDNARRNGVDAHLQTVCGDAFDALRALHQEGERFDVVIVDPPAFIKRRKDHRAGRQAYRRLNQLALQLLERNGILISASCSFHLAAAELAQTLLGAARHLDRGLQVVERGHQGRDHPVHPAIPETDYLKAFFCRLLPAR